MSPLSRSKGQGSNKGHILIFTKIQISFHVCPYKTFPGPGVMKRPGMFFEKSFSDGEFVWACSLHRDSETFSPGAMRQIPLGTCKLLWGSVMSVSWRPRCPSCWAGTRGMSRRGAWGGTGYPWNLPHHDWSSAQQEAGPQCEPTDWQVFLNVHYSLLLEVQFLFEDVKNKLWKLYIRIVPCHWLVGLFIFWIFKCISQSTLTLPLRQFLFIFQTDVTCWEIQSGVVSLSRTVIDAGLQFCSVSPHNLSTSSILMGWLSHIKMLKPSTLLDSSVC